MPEPADMNHPIVFTGSSIMAEWPGLPDRFSGLPVLNTARSGAHTADIRAGLEELILRHAPRAVGYYCGGNDIDLGVAPDAIVDNVVSTFWTLRQHRLDLSFIYFSIIRSPQKRERWDSVDAVNAHLSRLAEHSASLHFIDINPLFVDPDGSARMDFFRDDGLHLTPEAYAALGAHVAPRVAALLGQARES